MEFTAGFCWAYWCDRRREQTGRRGELGERKECLKHFHARTMIQEPAYHKKPTHTLGIEESETIHCLSRRSQKKKKKELLSAN